MMKLDIKRKCPYCAKTLDGVMASDGAQILPKPGDYAVCFGCCGYLEFTSTGLKKLDIKNVKNPRDADELISVVREVRRVWSEASYIN